MDKEFWIPVIIQLAGLIIAIMVYLQGEKIMFKDVINIPNLHIYVSLCFFFVFLYGFLNTVNKYRKSLKTIFQLSKSNEDWEKFKKDFFKDQKERDDEFRKAILTNVGIISNNVAKFEELAKQILKLS